MQVAWLTPSEIFTPHYGRAIASHILQQHSELPSEEPLQIIELGAGTGTLARDVLTAVQQVLSRMTMYQYLLYSSIPPVLQVTTRQRYAQQGFFAICFVACKKTAQGFNADEATSI